DRGPPAPRADRAAYAVHYVRAPAGVGPTPPPATHARLQDEVHDELVLQHPDPGMAPRPLHQRALDRLPREVAGVDDAPERVAALATQRVAAGRAAEIHAQGFQLAHPLGRISHHIA